MIIVLAIVGAVVALIPGASVILLPMELFMVYKIAKKHNAFEFGPFILLMAALWAISAFLIALVSFLHLIPVIGQIANSLVAFSFILILGRLAEQFYASRSKGQEVR